jgi:hydroxylamine reductase
MFCYQCEQTAKGTGCDVLGVCGKKPEVADLQDLLLYSLMGLSQVVLEGIRFGIQDRQYGVFTVKAAFSTLTNVDFDPQRFVDLIQQAVALREELKKNWKAAAMNPCSWKKVPPHLNRQ